jgi:4'-phosphopantetheinyl transferase
MNQLGPRDVHIWYVALDDLDAGSFTDVLSEDERERAARYRFDRDRHEFVISRGLLRQVLCIYSEGTPDCLSFRYGASGKPALQEGPHFNVSHAGGAVLIAVSCLQVGVDLERVEPTIDWEGIARHSLSVAECSYIRGQIPALRLKAFFRCWTRHEAYAKACGAGLARTKSTSCLDELVRDVDGRTWSLRSLRLTPGHVGAVCSAGENVCVTFCRWQEQLHLKINAPVLY